MRWGLRKWILSRVVRSAMAFEKEALELYRRLREMPAVENVKGGLEHLLEEEEMHWKLLSDIVDGRLDRGELERVLREHLYTSLPAIKPLSPDTLLLLGDELSKALEQEKQAFIFYGNLRRMSTIPSVKKAFEVLTDMEREHVEILSRLLGREGS